MNILLITACLNLLALGAAAQDNTVDNPYYALENCTTEEELYSCDDLSLQRRLNILSLDAWGGRQCEEDVKISGPGLFWLGWCFPNIQYIDVDENNFSSLKYFRALPRSLNIILTRRNTSIADNTDFNVFRHFPELRMLDLGGVALSQQAMNSLRNRNLKYLRFDGSRIESFRKLKKNTPNLLALVLEGVEQWSKQQLKSTMRARSLIQRRLMEPNLFLSHNLMTPEAQHWMLSSSPILLLNTQITDTQFANTLNERQNIKRVVIGRPVSVEELQVVLPKPLTLVFDIPNFFNNVYLSDAIKGYTYERFVEDLHTASLNVSSLKKRLYLPDLMIRWLYQNSPQSLALLSPLSDKVWVFPSQDLLGSYELETYSRPPQPLDRFLNTLSGSI